MNRILVLFLAGMIILPLAMFGCKSKTEKVVEAPKAETVETTSAVVEETSTTTEPAQTVATETIPPTAAPQMAEKPVSVPKEISSREKDIQTALTNAGFYAGAVDGKIGPKTKKAIEEFQKSKGLKVDGKVGSKTWVELEKYLTKMQ